MSANLIVWTNNASSLLASGITNASTTVTVTAGEGALFPTIAAGQYAVATLEDTSGNIEVVYVTGRTTDTMTITRAQENTSALAFASGSRFELRVTAGVLATLLQKSGADTLLGGTLGGALVMNGSGSIQGGEIAGSALRGAPGLTSNQILIPNDGSAPTLGGSNILTASNIVADMPSGAGVVISGMVLFWSGASNAIPAGYVLCDGNNGTPDLRDKFVLGGGGTLATTGGSAAATTGSATTGATSGPFTLTANEMPTHHHTGITFDSTVNTGSIGTFGVITNNTNGGFVQPRTLSNSSTADAGSGAAHSHPFTDPGHSHSITLPPYRALFAVMKT